MEVNSSFKDRGEKSIYNFLQCLLHPVCLVSRVVPNPFCAYGHIGEFMRLWWAPANSPSLFLFAVIKTLPLLPPPLKPARLQAYSAVG